MTTVNYYVNVYRLSDPKEAVIKFSELGTDRPTWFLLESTLGYRVDELSKLPEDWTAGLISLVVCNKDWEVRLEKEDPLSEELMMRVIAENHDECNCQNLRCRTFKYLTHYTRAIPGLEEHKLSKLIYREYFADDPSSGMPLLQHSRLCGFEQEN